MNPSIIYADDYSIVYSLKFRWKLEPCYDPSHVKLETYVGPILRSLLLYDLGDFRDHSYFSRIDWWWSPMAAFLMKLET